MWSTGPDDTRHAETLLKQSLENQLTSKGLGGRVAGVGRFNAGAPFEDCGTDVFSSAKCLSTGVQRRKISQKRAASVTIHA